jgi:hypothetical protein
MSARSCQSARERSNWGPGAGCSGQSPDTSPSPGQTADLRHALQRHPARAPPAAPCARLPRGAVDSVGLHSTLEGIPSPPVAIGALLALGSSASEIAAARGLALEALATLPNTLVDAGRVPAVCPPDPVWRTGSALSH